MARERGLRILALAEVKRFDAWSGRTREEALALIRIATAAGAEAVSLIPRNDRITADESSYSDSLRQALRELRPMLEDHGLVGLVEPLGFETCALRSKQAAMDAIESLGASGTFRLVHDTFHHHLAGGGPFFWENTGMLHISGVSHRNVPVSRLEDGHRGLVDEGDRLGNVAQIRTLRAAGYGGPVSFEAFAESVHQLADPVRELRSSMAYIQDQLETGAR